MISNRIAFTVCFPYCPEPVVDVWRTLVSILSKEKCLPKTFRVQQITGHPEELKSERRLQMDSSQIVELIIERNLNGFFVDTGHSDNSVCYSLVHAKELGQQSVLGCRIEQKTKALFDWTPLIEAMMAQWPCIGAWQWNTLYRAWQACSEVKGSNMFFGGVPLGFRQYIEPAIDALSKDREMIDISLNPGRQKQLLPTIHFYPTAEMWLGTHFWQYAKCTKEEALAADFFIEKRDTPHFLYLKSWPHPFTRPDGEQGRIQQKIWKLLFHEDCEWPPGSGGISDEPMYGPPELMP